MKCRNPKPDKRTGWYYSEYLNPTTNKISRVNILKVEEFSPANKELAQAKLPEIEIELQKRFAVSYADLTIAEIAAAYLEFKPPKNDADRQGSMAAAKAFNMSVKSASVKTLKKSQLDTFLGTVGKTTGYRRKVAAGILAATNHFARTLDDFIDPFAGFKRPRASEKNPHKRLTLPEVAILSQDPNRLFAEVTATIAYTGCRPGEILGLRGDEVDLEKGVITKTDWKTSGKNGYGDRAILDNVKEILKSRKEKYGDGLLFPTRAGRQWSIRAYDQLFKVRINHYGIDSRRLPHGLRYCFCTEMKRIGLSYDECAALLGHADSQMVKDIYCDRQELFQGIRDKAARMFASQSA
jgi:integrase